MPWWILLVVYVLGVCACGALMEELAYVTSLQTKKALAVVILWPLFGVLCLIEVLYRSAKGMRKW